MKKILFLILCVVGLYQVYGQSVSNALNPHDNVGNLHNEGLDYLMTKIGKNGQTNRTLLGQNLADFMVLKGISTREQALEAFSISEQNRNKDVREALLAAKWSTASIGFYNALRSKLGYESDLEQLIEHIKSVETQIVTDRTMTENEKKGLLIMASTLRYSLSYWSIYSTNNPSWGGNTINHITAKPPKSKWQAVADQDAGQALIWGAAALYTGGPYSGLVGWIAGGVSGSYSLF